MNRDFWFGKPQRWKWKLTAILQWKAVRDCIPPAQSLSELIWRTRNVCRVKLCKTRSAEKTQSFQEDTQRIIHKEKKCVSHKYRVMQETDPKRSEATPPASWENRPKWSNFIEVKSTAMAETKKSSSSMRFFDDNTLMGSFYIQAQRREFMVVAAKWESSEEGVYTDVHWLDSCHSYHTQYCPRPIEEDVNLWWLNQVFR